MWCASVWYNSLPGSLTELRSGRFGSFLRMLAYLSENQYFSSASRICMLWVSSIAALVTVLGQDSQRQVPRWGFARNWFIKEVLLGDNYERLGIRTAKGRHRATAASLQPSPTPGHLGSPCMGAQVGGDCPHESPGPPPPHVAITVEAHPGAT